MHLLRQRLGLATTARRFPQKGDLPGDLLARRQRERDARRRARRAPFPGAATTRRRCARLFAAYVGEKQAQRVLDFDDLLVWWAEAMADPLVGAQIASRFDHVLVDEYQDTNRLQAEIVVAPASRRQRPHRRRRRRAGDLFVPRRRGAQHPRLRRPLQPRRRPCSRSSRTTARRRRCWRRRTRSSPWPPSATPRQLWSERAGEPSGRRWSGSTTRAAEAVMGRRARPRACANPGWR